MKTALQLPVPVNVHPEQQVRNRHIHAAHDGREMTRASGEQLPIDIQNAAARRLGHDFAHVRVHHDQKAAASARQLGADAYTVGNHIAFAAGNFAPNSLAGRRLLYHELVHVVQQRQAAPAAADLQVSDPSSALEFEADRLSAPESSQAPIRVSGLAVHQHIARQTTHHDPNCDDLWVQIAARVLELYLRADALIRNPLKLPQSGPMSIEGHQQQFRNKQTNLRSMLNQWDTNNCGDGYLPRESWRWATRPVPSPRAEPAARRVPISSGGGEQRVPIRVGGGEPGKEWSHATSPPASGSRPRSGSDLSTGEAAAAAGATVGTGYLIYRAARMLPSLLPPLWWTVPENAAIP